MATADISYMQYDGEKTFGRTEAVSISTLNFSRKFTFSGEWGLCISTNCKAGDIIRMVADKSEPGWFAGGSFHYIIMAIT